MSKKDGNYTNDGTEYKMENTEYIYMNANLQERAILLVILSSFKECASVRPICLAWNCVRAWLRCWAGSDVSC